MPEMSDKKKLAVEAFREGMTTLEAAVKVGVSTKTLWRWAQADAEFADAVEEAKDKADDSVEAVTFKNCLDPDPAHNTLRMFWLKARRRDVFNPPQNVAMQPSTGQEPLGHEVESTDPLARPAAAPRRAADT